MNTSTSVLWQLIQSMTRSEKLYFKRKSIETGSAALPLYMKLFDVIVKQKEYNEEAILKKLSPKITKKNIAFQKHYLHNQLNENLIEYNNRNSKDKEIYKNIPLIRINRKNGFLNEARVLWEKTITKGRKAELF